MWSLQTAIWYPVLRQGYLQRREWLKIYQHLSQTRTSEVHTWFRNWVNQAGVEGNFYSPTNWTSPFVYTMNKSVRAWAIRWREWPSENICSERPRAPFSRSCNSYLLNESPTTHLGKGTSRISKVLSIHGISRTLECLTRYRRHRTPLG